MWVGGSFISEISQTSELCSAETFLRLLLAEPPLPAATAGFCFRGGREGMETVQDKDEVRNTVKWISVGSAV